MTEEEREAIFRDFSAYGRPLEMVNSFNYLGRVITVVVAKLAGGGEELVLGKGSLEENDAHPQQGGGSAAGVRLLF